MRISNCPSLPRHRFLILSSQLNIYLNGQLQQTAVLTKDMIGKPSKLVFSLNPKSMQTMNQVSIEFVGHIQSTCENPADDALWLNINAQSRLVLEKQRIRLGSDMETWLHLLLTLQQVTQRSGPCLSVCAVSRHEDCCGLDGLMGRPGSLTGAVQISPYISMKLRQASTSWCSLRIRLARIF